jgi:hypothetical protein
VVGPEIVSESLVSGTYRWCSLSGRCCGCREHQHADKTERNECVPEDGVFTHDDSPDISRCGFFRILIQSCLQQVMYS